MVKKLLVFAVVIFLIALSSAMAQTVENESFGTDSLRRIDAVNSDLVQLHKGDKGSMVVEVAGFGITLGQTPEQKRNTMPPRVILIFLNNAEIGFSTLTGVDYAGYSAAEAGFMDLKSWTSYHASFSFFGVQVALNKSRTLYFGADLNFSGDNFRLADNSIRLGYENGALLPVALDKPADKSRFFVYSAGIPLRLIYKPTKDLRIDAIAYCDFPLSISSMYTKPRVQYELKGLNVCQLGVGGSIRYCGVGLYVRYGVTPLFKKSAGPECHQLSAGLSIYVH